MERIAASGDEHAFRLLYAAHTPSLLRFVQRALGGDDAAEDVVQETWLRALTGVSGLRKRTAFGSWLRSVALNVVREHWRLRHRTDHEEFTDEWPDALRPIDIAIDLETALRELPRGQRLAVLLHDLEGYSHEEVGRMLDITVGTSKSQLHDGRRRLRQLLVRESA